MPLPTAYGTIPLGGALPEAYIPVDSIPLLGGALESGYGEVSYAVNMTAAGSGSNGITVADDDDIDFGTGDFFLHWEGSLPDWTPGGSRIFARKNNLSTEAGYVLLIDSSSIINFLLRSGTSTTTLLSTAAVSAPDNSVVKITISCARESASVAGSATFYVNGTQLGSPVAITAATPFSVSNALNLYVSGSSTTRTASNTVSFVCGNFAPTASEVLDLCTNGIPASWKWGSQTAAYTSDFSAGADGWVGNVGTTVTGNIDGINGIDNWLRAQRTSTTGAIGFSKPYTSGGFKFRVSTKFYNPAGSPFSYAIIGTALGPVSGAVAQSIPANAETVVTYDTPFFPSGSTDIRWILCDAAGSPVSVATGNPVYSKETTFTRLGATMALLPDTIPTSSATTWSDTSGNTGGGTLPAAGATKVTIRR